MEKEWFSTEMTHVRLLPVLSRVVLYTIIKDISFWLGKTNHTAKAFNCSFIRNTVFSISPQFWSHIFKNRNPKHYTFILILQQKF